MAKPTNKPNARNIILYDQQNQEFGDRNDSILNPINSGVEYGSDSIDFRETSATEITPTDNIRAFNLQENSLVRVSEDGNRLETRETIIPFADAGYSLTEKLPYGTISEIQQKYPLASNTDTQQGFELGNTNGYRYVGRPDTGRIFGVPAVFPFRFPAFPAHLPCRMRVVFTGWGRISLRHESPTSTLVAQSRAVFYPSVAISGNRENTRAIYGFLPDRSQDPALPDGTSIVPNSLQLSDGYTSTVVAEITHIPEYPQSNFARGSLKIRVGSYPALRIGYDTINSSGIFRCLDSSDPNYIGERTYNGSMDASFLGFTGLNGSTTPEISVVRLHYAEILAGDKCNDLINCTQGRAFSPDEQ